MAHAPAYVPHRIDIDEYHRMAAAGIFPSDARIELVDGELIERVAPMYPPHAAAVSKLSNTFAIAFEDRADVRNQVPVTLGSFSEPLPDIAVVAIDGREYFVRHPTPEDTYLIVEVCDSTRDLDRRKKIPLYAREGIREVWLVDLVDECLRVYRDSDGAAYRSIERYGRGTSIAPRAFPDLAFAVTSMLPPLA